MSSLGVWNTAFLGDAVLTLPLVQTLREAYPDAVIDFWVRKGFGSLFAPHPAITNVFEYDKRGADKGLFKAARLGGFLGRKRYGLWIGAHASPRSGMIARWTSAKIRIGYDHPHLNRWLYTHLVPRRFNDLDEIERLLQLLGPLGLCERGISPQTWPDIALAPEAEAKAGTFFATLSARFPGAPVLGLHPGSTWGTKRWPAGYYASIAAKTAEEGAVALVFGGPDERADAAEVAATAIDLAAPSARERIFDVAARWSLPELAAVIKRLACYITNDSGPMHLAWAQRVPVTAIFGPTVRELGFFPRGENSTVLEASVPCRPCGLHGPQICPHGHHRCMTDISPAMVWDDAAPKLFRRQG